RRLVQRRSWAFWASGGDGEGFGFQRYIVHEATVGLCAGAPFDLGNADWISATTSCAVSAHAVVPPFAYCLTASPTFHRPVIGVPWAMSNPATARCGGQSSRVTTVLRIRACSSNPGTCS